MTRVERIGDATLVLGDCRDYMRGEQWVVDHIITDPPYEARMHALHASTILRRTDGGPARKALDFGSVAEIRPWFIDAIVAGVNKGWLLAFCNVEGVGAWQDALVERGLKFKTTCIWVKPDATPKLNGQGPALAYECITTTWCGAGHSRWNGGGKRGVFVHLTNDPNRQGEHPTEKPTPLMRQLVGLFSQPNETILDPFMGSGTTGVACIQLGRKFIGVEIEPKYFDIACRRIEAATREPRLELPQPKPKQIAMPLDGAA